MKSTEKQAHLQKSKTNSCSDKVKIVKKCPNCDWRIFDKVTPTTGVIEIKCPNCRKIVTIDLAYRKK